jgi:apolipoprotein N-acyltransferase
VIARKQKYTYEEAKIMGANSLVELPRIDQRPISVVTTVPLGFFYALVQPTPMQAHGKALVFVNGIENLLFVVLFVFLLLKIQKKKGDRARLFWFLFFIAAVYLSFIGLLVPVLGNMVRYKAVVIPVLMAALLLLQKEQPVLKN